MKFLKGERLQQVAVGGAADVVKHPTTKERGSESIKQDLSRLMMHFLSASKFALFATVFLFFATTPPFFYHTPYIFASK
jgi:hypothetical protein